MVERELALADHPQTSTRAYTRVNLVKMILKEKKPNMEEGKFYCENVIS